MLNKLITAIKETNTNGEEFKYRKFKSNRIELIYWCWGPCTYKEVFSEILNDEDFEKALEIFEEKEIKRDILNFTFAEEKEHEAYRWTNELASKEELLKMKKHIEDLLSRFD